MGFHVPRGDALGWLRVGPSGRRQVPAGDDVTQAGVQPQRKGVWIKKNPEGVTECVPLIACRPFRALVCWQHERGLHSVWGLSVLRTFGFRPPENHIGA